MLVRRRPVKPGLLRSRRFLLVLLPPLVVRHAVNFGPRLVFADAEALLSRRFLHPVAQAVAAEPGQVHQVDVLYVGPLAQMSD